MKFLEKLFSQESRSTPESELQQAEREAIIDLLLMAIYVDQHLSLAETKEFDHAADSLGWDSSTGSSVYICNATDRARTARISEELTADFIAPLICVEEICLGSARALKQPDYFMIEICCASCRAKGLAISQMGCCV
ncbi:MAG: hypothetical protein CML13_07555 [Puniceicoccaceae bacterium]|nr:hypothetical protein [Puniceicoccaceae bacterium]|tara:strand:+ start:16891 stop:17301 length:411 start_codon:yes stop_codon:yes gene_type:complete